MRNRLQQLLGLALVVVHAAAYADEPAPAVRITRQHTVLADAKQRTLYVVTDINEMDEARHINTTLVEDVFQGQRWVMKNVYDVTKPTATAEISDLSGKVYVRRSYERPVTAKTTAEVRKQMDANPELFDLANVPIKIETPSFTHVLRESEFIKTEPPRMWVSELRRTLNPDLLDALERMRATGFFASSEAMGFYNGFIEYFFHSECGASLKLAQIYERPDCDFDKSFGYPCSAKQVERITKARSEQRTLKFY